MVRALSLHGKTWQKLSTQRAFRQSAGNINPSNPPLNSADESNYKTRLLPRRVVQHIKRLWQPSRSLIFNPQKKNIPHFIKQRCKLLKRVLCLWAALSIMPERTCLALHAFMLLGLSSAMYNYAISPPFYTWAVSADSIVEAIFSLRQWAFWE